MWVGADRLQEAVLAGLGHCFLQVSQALLPCAAWAALNLLYAHSSEWSSYCSCCLCGCGTLDAHQRGVTVERKVPAAFLQVLTLCSPCSTLRCSSPGTELHAGLLFLERSVSSSAEWMEVDVPTAVGQRAGASAPWMHMWWVVSAQVR